MKIAEVTEVMAFYTAVMRGEIQEEVLISVAGEKEIVGKAATVKDRLEAAKQLAKRYGADRAEGANYEILAKIFVANTEGLIGNEQRNMQELENQAIRAV